MGLTGLFGEVLALLSLRCVSLGATALLLLAADRGSIAGLGFFFLTSGSAGLAFLTSAFDAVLTFSALLLRATFSASVLDVFLTR